MDGKFQLAIANLHHYLSEKLSTDTPMLNKYRDAGIISDYQKAEILSIGTSYDKADKLINCLKRCPDDKFDIFCEILVDAGQQDVVNSLLRNLSSRLRQNPIVSTIPEVETPHIQQPTSEQQTRDSSRAEPSALSQMEDLVQISAACGAMDHLSLQSLNRTAESLTLTLVRSLPEDKPIFGITTLLDELYIWHEDLAAPRDIAVYDTSTFTLQRHLSVAGLGVVGDMVSCTKYQCVYIADRLNNTIHRIVKATNEHTRWRLDAQPCRLSINSEFNLISTFDEARKIMVFSTHGELVKQISLQQEDIVNPYHTLQLKADTYAVSHGLMPDHKHRVCVLDGSGRLLTLFGGAKGSDDQLLNAPLSLAIVKNEFIFVADHNNFRVAILALSPLRCVQLLKVDGKPVRMWFDEQADRLYVAVNTDYDPRTKKHTYGHVKVFSVSS